MRVITSTTVAAPLLAALWLAWPDATCQMLAVMVALAWRLHHNAKEVHP